MTLNKLLIIDDDDVLREELAEQFKFYENFLVVTTATATEGLELLNKHYFNLIILDINLPDYDGHEICRRIRKNGINIPIIMLTGADGVSDEILSLESGANDYISKPFKLAILLARIRAHMRSYEQSEDAIFQIGPYAFLPALKLLNFEDGKKIRLTEKESSILKYLYKAKGKTVTREELLLEIWGYNSLVTTHTLETHIYRLRQKIEPESSAASYLLTESGGYRLSS